MKVKICEKYILMVISMSSAGLDTRTITYRCADLRRRSTVDQSSDARIAGASCLVASDACLGLIFVSRRRYHECGRLSPLGGGHITSHPSFSLKSERVWRVDLRNRFSFGGVGLLGLG